MVRLAILSSIGLGLLAASAMGAEPRRENGYYQGKLAKKAITMVIGLDTPDSGEYRYLRYGPPIQLGVDGVLGGVALTEDVDGRPNGGRFEGHLDSQNNLAGVWTSADEKRSYDFTFRRIADLAEYGVHQPKFSVDYSVPQFTAKTAFYEKLNDLLIRRLKKEMNAWVSDFHDDAKDPSFGNQPYESSTSTEVLYADDSMVSLLYTTDSFTGGVHGNTGYSSATFVWRDGRIVELRPGDMISTDSYSRMNAILIENLERQKAGWPERTAKILLDNEVVNPTVDGLLFTFAPYQVDCFAGGTYTVMVPWSRLGNIIPVDSPVDRLMAKQMASTALP